MTAWPVCDAESRRRTELIRCTSCGLEWDKALIASCSRTAPRTTKTRISHGGPATTRRRPRLIGPVASKGPFCTVLARKFVTGRSQRGRSIGYGRPIPRARALTCAGDTFIQGRLRPAIARTKWSAAKQSSASPKRPRSTAPSTQQEKAGMSHTDERNSDGRIREARAWVFGRRLWSIRLRWKKSACSARSRTSD